MFEKEIEEYERIRADYKEYISALKQIRIEGSDEFLATVIFSG